MQQPDKLGPRPLGFGGTSHSMRAGAACSAHGTAATGRPPHAYVQLEQQQQ